KIRLRAHDHPRARLALFRVRHDAQFIVVVHRRGPAEDPLGGLRRQVDTAVAVHTPVVVVPVCAVRRRKARREVRYPGDAGQVIPHVAHAACHALAQPLQVDGEVAQRRRGGGDARCNEEGLYLFVTLVAYKALLADADLNPLLLGRHIRRDRLDLLRLDDPHFGGLQPVLAAVHSLDAVIVVLDADDVVRGIVDHLLALIELIAGAGACRRLRHRHHSPRTALVNLLGRVRRLFTHRLHPRRVDIALVDLYTHDVRWVKAY